jgi:K+-transporting ATPase ATPase C chain
MSVLVITVLTGLIFPAVVFAIGKVAFPYQANGSLIRRGGRVVGSRLIGQNFSAPGYFHPRPSANGYDATNSGGTNLGPTSNKLINGDHKKLPNGTNDPNYSNNFDGIVDLAAAYRKDNGLDKAVPLPADAVTRSASGLDPDISPANAQLQVNRVADTRKLSRDYVKKLVEEHTTRPQFGFLGEARVNVLELNLALDGK